MNFNKSPVGELCSQITTTLIYADCHGITELEMLEISFIGKVKTELGFERCIEVCSEKKRERKVFRQRKEP